jgi:hypothetical protein
MMEVFTCEQGTPEWFAARMGIPTASQFATVCAKGEGKTRTTYMHKLAGEVLTGEPMDSVSNAHMERGHAMEPDARNLYAMMHDADPELVGFIRDGRAGASPDALIGADGMLEIKTKLPHLQIEAILAEKMPAAHRKQVQGQLWIARREWCDFVSYWPGLPLFVVREHRDEKLIAEISAEVDRFNADLDGIVSKIRAMGLQEDAA